MPAAAVVTDELAASSHADSERVLSILRRQSLAKWTALLVSFTGLRKAWPYAPVLHR
jgi:hypothetical protein